MNNIKTGILGENIAFRYLCNAGYKIIARNLKIGFDELDIIGIDPRRDLVFFEVKSLFLKDKMFNSLKNFIPEDNFSGPKLKRITRACEKFAGSHSYLIDDGRGWRIDLVAISIVEGLRYTLHHYKNI